MHEGFQSGALQHNAPAASAAKEVEQMVVDGFQGRGNVDVARNLGIVARMLGGTRNQLQVVFVLSHAA